MKKLAIIFMNVVFVIIATLQITYGQSTQVIHGDTIYFDAGSYYLIDGDTMMLDPGHITLEYNGNASEQQKSTIESTYLLTERLTTYKDRVIYKTNPLSDYLTLLSSLPNESYVETLFYEFIFQREINVDTTTSSGPGDNIWPDDTFYWDNMAMLDSIFVHQDDAWTITTGNPNIIIGLLDNSSDWTQPDLGLGNDTYQNIAINQDDPWEYENFPSGDGIDNDGNGLIDDYKGWDYYNGDNDVRPPDPTNNMDDWIPTSLACMVAGKINNTYGVSGVAGGWNPTPGCKVLTYKIGEGNTFNTAYATEAIYAAIEQGASIINMSWFYFGTAQSLIDAIEDGYENHNINFFSMSGEATYGLLFPAKHPYVNCVAGTISLEGERMRHCNFSAFGPEVDFCTPCNIYGLKPYNNELFFALGTWNSSALATGVAGLLLSVNPCLKNYEVTEILQNTAIKIGDPNIYQYSNGHNIYLGYGHINAYDALQMAMNEEYLGLPEHTISIPEIWNDDERLNGDIIIEDGGVLTLYNNTIEMKPGLKILVEVGGRLIIDGATITSFCDGMLDGIVVQGNPNISQVPYSNQGSVLMINGAAIENALCAIQVYDDNGNEGSMANGGGYIIANDAEFLNNKISVSFGSYSLNNFSSLTDCLFKCNGDYLIEGDEQEYFVKFFEIDGVDIINCEFTETGYDGACRGVYSYNSAFTIDGECTNMGQDCLAWDPTTFTNLEYAVYATCVGSTRSFSVKHSTFTNNFRGIYASGINFVRAWSNTFNIPNSRYNNMSRHGFYLNNCTGYNIEDNNFNGTGTGQPVSVGLYISNSGPWANWVYRNNFDNLYCGSVANGRNRAATGEGLCYKCNNFSNNIIDISVPRIKIPDGPNEYGIAYSQGYASGTDTTGAANTFSSNSQYDFINELAYLVYTHHQLWPNPLEIIPDPRTVAKIGLDEDDLSNFDGPGVCDPWMNNGSTPTEGLKSGIAGMDIAIAQTESLMAAAIDGGDTEELNSGVQYSFPPDAMEVQQELLGKSPYLSDTVMQTAIAKEEVLPNAMIRDVLVANPQAAKSEEVMATLDVRATPIPESMLAEIYEGLYTKGALDELRLQMAVQKQKRGTDWLKLYELYLTQGTYDSANLLLNTENTLAEIDAEDYSNALATLNQLPSQYQLSATQLGSHNYFIEVVGTLNDLFSEGKTVMQLDSQDIDGLMQVAANEESWPGVLAINLLTAAEAMDYYEPMLLPDPYKSAKVLPERPGEANTTANNQLRLFPNPAGTYFIIEYALEKTVSDAAIRITDVLGREIIKIPVSKQYDQMVVHTNTMDEGIYLVTLEVNGIILQTDKLTISK